MKIQLLSDIHIEFGDREPVSTDADLVILAGDIHTKGLAFDWIRRHFPSQRVIYIAGNHEYYGEHLERMLDKLRAQSDDHIRFMDQDQLVIDGVRLLAGTGWTDFLSTGNRVLAMWEAQAMLDYKKIRTGTDFRKLNPTDVAARSVAFRSWLKERLYEPFEGKTVVVTHHAPLLLPSHSSGSHLDASFSNNWMELVEQADLWLYGHTHQAADFTIGRCRLVSNPVGYPNEDAGFDGDLLIRI
jgi:predicted phosphodiesterase